MKQAFKGSLESRAASYEHMKLVAHAHTSKCECSLQEADYQVIAKRKLRKVFPGVFLADSNILEKRIRMMSSERKISLNTAHLFIKKAW